MPSPTPDDLLWYLIEAPGQAPRCDRLSASQRRKLARQGARLVPLVWGPLVIPGDTSLIAYPVEDIGFHPKIQSEYFHAAVRDLPASEIPEGKKPADLTEDEINPGEVIAFSGSHAALLHVFWINRRGSLKLELLKPGHVEIDAREDRYGIEDDRTLKRVPSALSFCGRNYRSNGEIISFTVGHQDLLKAPGQSVWHEESRIIDVRSQHLTPARDYIRSLANRVQVTRSRIDGLGPVRISDDPAPNTDSAYITVFVGTSGSFETATGKERPDIYADVRGKPGLSIFGLSPKTDDMKLAYEEFFKLGDCCPDDRGLCMAPAGILVLTALSAIKREYRVPVGMFGKSGSGKTGFAKLLLATQSPYARGYSNIDPTVSARPARRGGSTTNGINMLLQYAGGFLALVDDYTTKEMTAQTMLERGEGLSILVGSLEGEAPSKQTWTRAGPDFAQGYKPQSSFMVNGERWPTAEESIVNRFILLFAPEIDFMNDGGFDSEHIRALDSAESGDLRHTAFCDLDKFTLANPAIVEDAFVRACGITAAWHDIDNQRMRDRYAVAIAGWIVALERARDAHGLDKTDTLPGISSALYATALRQYRLISGAANMPDLIRGAIRSALDDQEISFPGPPDYDDTGKQISSCTAPNFVKMDNPEEDSELPLPDFLSSWTQLGLTFDSGNVPGLTPASKRYAGYFRSPRKQRKGRYSYPYRVQMTREHIGILSRILEKRSGREGIFTESVIRDALLSSPEIAKHGKALGKNDDKCRVVEINAEWLFSSESEES